MASPEDDKGENEAKAATASNALSPVTSHMAVEAAEYKAKIRKLNQQL